MFSIKVIATGSEGNCCIISDGWTSIIIDVGVHVVNAASMGIEGVLLSHEHGDHCKFVHIIAHAGIKVYATKGTFRAIGAARVGSAMRHIVEYGKQFSIGTFKIIPFEVNHDAAEPCGYYIKNRANETICFISDTGSIEHIEAKADCYMLEANYDEETLDRRLEDGEIYEGLHARLTSDFGHLSVQQATTWVEANASKESHIILLHKSKDNVGKLEVLEGYNVTLPDEKGQLDYQFGVDDRCPFMLCPIEHDVISDEALAFLGSRTKKNGNL